MCQISICIALWNSNNPERKAIYQNFLFKDHKLMWGLYDLFGSIHEERHCSIMNRHNWARRKGLSIQWAYFSLSRHDITHKVSMHHPKLRVTAQLLLGNANEVSGDTRSRGRRIHWWSLCTASHPGSVKQDTCPSHYERRYMNLVIQVPISKNFSLFV